MPRHEDEVNGEIKMFSDAKRVLIYRLGSLGDTLVALPALRLISRAFPNAERRMITTGPPNIKAVSASAVLENTGLVDGYITYNYGTRSIKSLARVWWQLAIWRPQVLVYLGGDKITLQRAARDAKFFRICGVSRLLGIPVDNEMLEHQRIIKPGRLGYESEASRLARNIAELGDARIEDPASWSLDLTEAERSSADILLTETSSRPIMAISLGTKMQSKDWGASNWMALTERLVHSYRDYALVLCGAPDEWALSDEAGATWIQRGGGPVINLCGKVNARQSGAVLERARVFIGHDSGPMHLAASSGVPCVAIFSSRDTPDIWFPSGKRNRILYHDVDCAGCRLETCIEQRKKCILSVTVDEVMSAIDSVLSPFSPGKHGLADLTSSEPIFFANPRTATPS